MSNLQFNIKSDNPIEVRKALQQIKIQTNDKFVPYSGAISDVDLDTKDLIATDITSTSLSAERLVASDANDKLISSDLTNWIAGTINQITSTDDTNGGVILSTPQDIDTNADVQFNSMVLLSGAVINGVSFPDILSSLNHSSLLQLDYTTSGHTGFEPEITKGDLTAGDGISLDNSGVGTLIGTSIEITNSDRGSDAIKTLDPNLLINTYPVFKTTTSITLKTGYGVCNGNYFKMTADIDLTIDAFSNGSYTYIYIDDSESSYPIPTFISSTTVPAWSDSLFGWYNGDDRCIGALYCDSASTIEFFFSNQVGNIVEVIPDMSIQLASDMNPDGTWQTPNGAESSTKLPINAVKAKFYGLNDHTATTNAGLMGVQAKELVDLNANVGAQMFSYAYGTFRVQGWCNLGASRNVRIKSTNTASNYMNLYLRGYAISR